MPNYKDIKPQFPNRFSRMLGDKVFGLLLLHHMGYKVPYCTIINRHVAPFSIGTKTFTGDKWTRTAPYEKQGGLFDTIKGYEDIFLFMGKNEDMHSEKNNQIASIIIQDGVTPVYSGGALVSNSKIVVEGVIGAGDGFMVGENTSDIPEYIREKINKKIQEMNLVDNFGNCSIEWVCDGDTMWLLQVNQLSTDVDDNVVVPCDHVNDFIVFDIKDKTLNDLRELIANNSEDIKVKDKGIIIKGNVGISSHYGDLLRKHKIPSKIMR